MKKRKIYMFIVVLVITSLACGAGAEFGQVDMADNTQLSLYVPLEIEEVLFGVTMAMQQGIGTSIMTLASGSRAFGDSFIFTWLSQVGPTGQQTMNFAFVTFNPTGVTNAQDVINMISSSQSTTNMAQGRNLVTMLEGAGYRYVTAGDLAASWTATLRAYVDSFAMSGQILWSRTWPTFFVVPAGTFNQTLDTTLEGAYGYSITPIDG